MNQNPSTISLLAWDIVCFLLQLPEQICRVIAVLASTHSGPALLVPLTHNSFTWAQLYSGFLCSFSLQKGPGAVPLLLGLPYFCKAADTKLDKAALNVYEVSQASSLLCRQTLQSRHLRQDGVTEWGISRGRSIFRAWGFIITSEKLIHFLFCAGGLCTSSSCRRQNSDTWNDETCQLPADVTAWVERLVLAFTISEFAHISILPELVFQKLLQSQSLPWNKQEVMGLSPDFVGQEAFVMPSVKYNSVCFHQRRVSCSEHVSSKELNRNMQAMGYRSPAMAERI